MWTKSACHHGSRSSLESETLLLGSKSPQVSISSIPDKYYDAQSFYQTADKFFGQLVEIIDANDQLEVSCNLVFLS